jgi:hypothetical protein
MFTPDHFAPSVIIPLFGLMALAGVVYIVVRVGCDYVAQMPLRVHKDKDT